jgi:hypothetical protein
MKSSVLYKKLLFLNVVGTSLCRDKHSCCLVFTWLSFCLYNPPLEQGLCNEAVFLVVLSRFTPCETCILASCVPCMFIFDWPVYDMCFFLRKQQQLYNSIIAHALFQRRAV